MLRLFRWIAPLLLVASSAFGQSTSTDRLQGLSTSVAIKAPVKTVSTTSLTLSGLQTVGGVALAEGDRVLVKDQSDATENGIYNASTSDWQRAKDFDGPRDIVNGTLVIALFSNDDGVLFQVGVDDEDIDFGTTEITFRSFSDPNVVYPQTAAEATNGVTPVNTSYPACHSFQYLSTAQIADVVSRNASIDLTSALQDWVDCGDKRLYAPAGKYRVAGTITVTGTGITIDGESDYYTEFVADGSGPWLQIGDSSYTLIEHFTLQNVTHIAGANFTGDSLIKTKQAFQTYFIRVRYKRTLTHPDDAIYILDNNSGESELPVRVTFRDMYVDGDNYAVSPPEEPTPVAVWIPSGIQVIFDNAHIQDAEIGIKIGYDPSTDTDYAGSNDDAYDIQFVNNSRIQIGDRGYTTTFARAFDVWTGGNLIISGAQIYLNNNGPDPGLASQRIIKFNAEWTNAVIRDTQVNFNSRAYHAVEVAADGDVGLLTFAGNNFGAQVADKDLVLVQSGGSVRTLIEPSNNFTNPNSLGRVHAISNGGSATLDLGTATGLRLSHSDGQSRSFSAFENGIQGVEYLVEIELSGGSTLTMTTVTPDTATGIVTKEGWPGTYKLYDGDILKVRRSDSLIGDKYLVEVMAPGYSETIASAATIALPARGNVFNISGTTAITSITATGQDGRIITLVFADALTFTDGSNLKINGNYTTANESTITLVCAGGTNWYEVGASPPRP